MSKCKECTCNTATHITSLGAGTLGNEAKVSLLIRVFFLFTVIL